MIVTRTDCDGSERKHEVQASLWRVTRITFFKGAQVSSFSVPPCFEAESAYDAKNRALELIACADKGLIESIEVEKTEPFAGDFQ